MILILLLSRYPQQRLFAFLSQILFVNNFKRIWPSDVTVINRKDNYIRNFLVRSLALQLSSIFQADAG